MSLLWSSALLLLRGNAFERFFFNPIFLNHTTFKHIFSVYLIHWYISTMSSIYGHGEPIPACIWWKAEKQDDAYHQSIAGSVNYLDFLWPELHIFELLDNMFKYTPIRHNIMTTCRILWRFPSCSQNSSDLSRHGLQTSEGVLCCLAPGRL